MNITRCGIKIHLPVGTTPEYAVRAALELANQLRWPVTFDWSDSVYFTISHGEVYDEALGKFRELLDLVFTRGSSSVARVESDGHHVESEVRPASEKAQVTACETLANEILLSCITYNSAGMVAQGEAEDAVAKGITKSRELERATIVAKGRAAADAADILGKHTGAETLRLFVAMIERGE